MSYFSDLHHISSSSILRNLQLHICNIYVFFLFLDQFHKSTQTDEVKTKPPEFDDLRLSPKSVRERINDLNLSQRLRKNSTPISPEVKPLGFHGTPWSSPLGCAKYLSVSAENINARPCSPDFKEKSSLAASQGALDASLQSKLSKLQLSEEIYKHMDSVPFQVDDTITIKTLCNLQKTPSKMTAFEVKNLVVLLNSANEDVLLKTLYTISNCAAFTRNQVKAKYYKMWFILINFSLFSY